MIVILDSNALLMVFQFKVNMESELTRLLGKYEIVVPSTVKKELKSLRNKYAKSALSFSERYRTINAKGSPDDSILELAEKEKGVVLTNDKILKKRLREKNIPVVFLRSKNHLEIEGSIK
ncbi:MAG: twitching motility protein PilT [Thermoplasmatales archaeon]|nr:twitching motility protein PilT [Thermoplasmatales archaeon]